MQNNVSLSCAWSLVVGPIGCRPYHCFFLLLLLHQSLSRRINIINIFMIWALQSTYYTSPESWGHCLSYRDDNDNDKHTHKDKDKDKDEDKDKDKVLKRPITCYIFEKQGVQGYQIWHLQNPVSRLLLSFGSLEISNEKFGLKSLKIKLLRICGLVTHRIYPFQLLLMFRTGTILSTQKG